MFDIDLPGGESYRESKAYRPGGRTVVAETPWGKLGMSVCYDVRFPHLYAHLAQAGADFLAVPSVFTVPTGTAHLACAVAGAAIENGCFVLAPAAWGEHTGGRRSYGHSLIVDPWGKGPGRRRRGHRDRHRPNRPGADFRKRAAWCRRSAQPRVHPARSRCRTRWRPSSLFLGEQAYGR